MSMLIKMKKTMTSTELSVLLGTQKKHVNEKIKLMFQDKIDGRVIRPSLDSRGYVQDYHLPELESKMFVAKHDINYLEQITLFWIENAKTPKLTHQQLWLKERNSGMLLVLCLVMWCNVISINRGNK